MDQMKIFVNVGYVTASTLVISCSAEGITISLKRRNGKYLEESCDLAWKKSKVREGPFYQMTYSTSATFSCGASAVMKEEKLSMAL